MITAIEFNSWVAGERSNVYLIRQLQKLLSLARVGNLTLIKITRAKMRKFVIRCHVSRNLAVAASTPGIRFELTANTRANVISENIVGNLCDLCYRRVANFLTVWN